MNVKRWITAFNLSAARYPQYRWRAIEPFLENEFDLYLYGQTVQPHPSTREFLCVQRAVDATTYGDPDALSDAALAKLMDAWVDQMAAMLEKGA